MSTRYRRSGMTERPVPPLPSRLRKAALLLWPVAELVIVILLAEVIGIWWTLLALAVCSGVGVALVRREWRVAFGGLQEAARTGRLTRPAVGDSALRLVGSILIAVPGFLGALAGLILFVPLTRRWTRRLIPVATSPRLWTRMPGSTSGLRQWPGDDDEVVEGEIVDDEEDPPSS